MERINQQQAGLTKVRKGSLNLSKMLKEMEMKKMAIVLSSVLVLALVIGWAAAADRPESAAGSGNAPVERLDIPDYPDQGRAFYELFEMRESSVGQNPDIRAHGEAFYELYDVSPSIVMDLNPDIRANAEAFYELFDLNGAGSMIGQNPDIRSHAEAFYELYDLNAAAVADQNPDIRAHAEAFYELFNFGPAE